MVFPVTAQEIRFRFNPPDRSSYVQTYRNTQIQDMGPLGKQTDVSELKAKVTIEKTSDGYSLVARPVSFILVTQLC